MKTAYLALGSNLGDRLSHLSEAVRRLAGDGEVVLTAVSSVYATEPVGFTDQPEFLNLVIRVETTLAPQALLARCLSIEAQLGRVRRERWGPRVIDLDLLWYEDAREASASLTLPHPRMHERAFVLAPLVEIAPELPVGDGSAQAALDRLGTHGVRRAGSLPLAGGAEKE